MAKLDDIVDELTGYLTGKRPAPSPERLQALLKQRNPFVISKTAACAARFAQAGLTGALQAAFDVLLDGAKSDPGCVAKKGLIKALDEMALDDTDWFIHAAQTVQWEPAMGGKKDTAFEVRVTAVQALCRFEWYKVAHALINRLGDAEPKVRMAAVCTVAAFSGREAELIVLTKLACGDPIPEVMGEAFRALNSMETADRLDILTGYLKNEVEAVGLEAAFAVGESKLAEGFELLSREWEETLNPERRKVLLLAISTLRTPEALGFLGELKDDRTYGELVRKTLSQIRPDSA